MIQLNPDYLVFETSNGDYIPCSAEMVAIELIGEAVSAIEPEIIKNAASAVLYYFRHEKQQTCVSIGEFTLALEKALRSLGLNIVAEEATGPRVAELDMTRIACGSASVELLFFQYIRDELVSHLRGTPEVVRFTGLRRCVKQLQGAQRWSNKCQQLSDHIVEYLRNCLCENTRGANCSLVVS